jgi:hypothetical protein
MNKDKILTFKIVKTSPLKTPKNKNMKLSYQNIKPTTDISVTPKPTSSSTPHNSLIKRKVSI